MTSRRSAWVLNFDADDELAGGPGYAPSRAVAARLASLVEHVGPLLASGDVVIHPALTAAPIDARGAIGRAFCPTPRALTRLSESGASPARSPSFDVLRRVNDRRFCFALGASLAGARLVGSLDEAERALVSMPDLGTNQFVLKRLFGFSGRGLRKTGRALDVSSRGFIEGAIRSSGAVQIEPWVHRVGDFGLHGHVSERGAVTLGEPTKQACDERGAWRGTVRAGPADLEAHERRALTEATREVAEALIGAGYFGPFGVDAFAWLDADGARRFQARAELNARYSMGFATGMGQARPDLAGDSA